MAIDPNNIDTVTVPELDTAVLLLTNYLAHTTPTGKLHKATINDLATFIAPYVASIGASGYIAVSGTVLPNPTSLTSAFTLVKAGTFTQTTGGNVVTTATINILSWNGTTWTLTSAIPIDLTDYVLKTGLNSTLTAVRLYEKVIDQNVSQNITTPVISDARVVIFNYPIPVGYNSPVISIWCKVAGNIEIGSYTKTGSNVVRSSFSTVTLTLGLNVISNFPVPTGQYFGFACNTTTLPGRIGALLESAPYTYYSLVGVIEGDPFPLNTPVNTQRHGVSIDFLIEAAKRSDLDNYIPIAQRGSSNGVATLDSGVEIPRIQEKGEYSLLMKNEILTIDGFILTNGSITSNSSFKRSDRIGCKGTKKMELVMAGGSSVAICFFDESNVLISGHNEMSSPSGAVIVTLDVPANTDNFIVSVTNAVAAVFYCAIYDRVAMSSIADAAFSLSPAKIFDVADRNTNTFVGGMNTVLDALIAAKPTAKFVFISNYTEDIMSTDGNGKPIIDMQRLVANYWCGDFLDLSRKMGLVKRDGINTLQTWVPDGTHPASDPAFVIVNNIARYCEEFLKPIFPSWTGKKIAWYGTSIPAGNPVEANPLGQYPLITATLLGCDCDNYAVSSSLVRLTNTNGTPVMVGRPSFLDTSNGMNYQLKMVDLIGTVDEPDLFVFDYGRNDFVQDPTDFNINQWKVAYE